VVKGVEGWGIWVEEEEGWEGGGRGKWGLELGLGKRGETGKDARVRERNAVGFYSSV